MQLIKNIIVPCLLLLIVNGLSINLHAQQKPSEKPFVAEMKKIKEQQAATNAKIRQIQKPADHSSSSNSNQGQQQVQVSNASTKNNVDAKQNTADSMQQSNKIKPSARPIQKPVRH